MRQCSRQWMELQIVLNASLFALHCGRGELVGGDAQWSSICLQVAE